MASTTVLDRNIYEWVGHVYTSSVVSAFVPQPHCRIATMNYDIERTKLKFSERSFAVSGPTAWNTTYKLKM